LNLKCDLLVSNATCTAYSEVGVVWMLAFPGLVMTAWIIPALWRHRYVTGGLAVLQSAAGSLTFLTRFA
jgi:hypothetical protein